MFSKLDFNDGFETEPSKYERFMTFVDRSMVLRSSPVLETLKLDVGPCCTTEDMTRWIRIGMVQDMRELEIVHFEESFEEHRPIKLPNTLYTYEKLEVLKLTYSIILDVPIAVCFPSLKTLHLMCVEYETKECYRRLLSGCPVLEELVMDKAVNSNYLRSFYVEMPTLQRLYVIHTYREPNFHYTTVINVPSLKYLEFLDFYSELCLCKNMPEVVEANVKVVYKNPEKLLGSIPSVKRLYLCLSAYKIPPHGIEFYHLVHLELCAYSLGWWDLLTWMLTISPKLQVLKICECNERPCTIMPIRGHWRGPSAVPECLIFHLHTFKWKNYKSNGKEKKIVAYILKNARQLKILGISAWQYYSKKERSQKLNELFSLPRASSSCQLLLD
ncbi:unnamed protein product [Thlaspi arvense]|uniref:FBD domain-containing protein n=1 Tax=Thlaspi arvense TaxID=13288 RepID=A0AAU9T904_THLAR|nr:unnamed protein product [Thlaspi arvense]